MIKSILLTVTASLVLHSSSCKRNAAGVPENSMPGKWKLVLMTGGIGSVRITAAQWGHTRSYQIRDDGTFTKVEDGKSTTGRYSVGEEVLKGSGATINTVTLDGTERYSYSFAHDTLVLSMYGISDPMYDWYVRE